MTSDASMSRQSLERPRSGRSSRWEWHIHFMSTAHYFVFYQSRERHRPPHLTGWKDTVLVEDKAELLVAFNRPATREHPFMYHCHILEHEEAGLMGQYVCA